ncbi:methylated-DNA--[protein]-cysteine S-methyltransferase [Nocardia spumae]|uniref:methylated-DNA--[protein]-cysteine S-methyltransferase n=1 Tax=Nocardia spumae TaxID=2887190 RepID=UPI003556E16C
MSVVSVTEFDTAIGRCAMAWTEGAVVRFQLPELARSGRAPGQTPGDAGPREFSAFTTGMLRRGVGSIPAERVRHAEPDGAMAEVIAAVRAHLSGELDALRWIGVDYRAQPEFHRAVYDVTRAIDPGHTLTYGEVAARIGAPGAAQAVGQALGRNPIPLIVPCHRVLAADHGLHGFSAPGGIATKARLLEIERTSGFGEPMLF